MAESYNGWPASADPDDIDVVQSSYFPGGVKAGDVTTVFRYLVEQFNARVEPIVDGWCWGYSYRANVNNPSSLSCHASGTALDINAPDHPNGVRGTFTSAQRGTIYEILDELQGAVHWLDGVDGGTADEMHFEITVDAATLARIATQLPGPKPEPPPEIGVDQMFALIRCDGKVYRWNGIHRVWVPNEQMLGGDRIMLGVLGMNNEVWDVDPWWASTFPEVTDFQTHWNTVLIAEQVGCDPATVQ
jgi:hypothetical protein